MRKSKIYVALLMSVLLLALSVFSALGTPSPVFPTITVLGDSIASGYGLDDVYDSYATLIAKEKYYNVSNCAVAGHTSSDLLWVVCHDEITRQDLKDSELVIISIGGNDIIELLQNADAMTLRDILINSSQSQAVINTAQTIQEKLLYSCMEIRLLNPDAPIILQTQYNPLYAHADYAQLAPYADKLAPVFTQIISSISAQLPDIYSADIYTAFDNYYKENQSYDIIQQDGIHPSEKGHALIAQVIIQVMEHLEDEGILIRNSRYYYLLGDTNGSGTVNISDATLIQKYLASLVIFNDDIVRLCADADCSGEVDIKDATAIQKHIAGLNPDSSIDTLFPYFPE